MKKYTIFLCVLIGLSMLALLASCKTTANISVDEENSYFSDYVVEENKVYIKCHIILTNTYDVEKTVKLSAKLPDDAANGLLKQEIVKALNEDGSETAFVLPPHSTESYDVVFAGEFAGNKQKQDRRLPEIVIDIAE